MLNLCDILNRKKISQEILWNIYFQIYANILKANVKIQVLEVETNLKNVLLGRSTEYYGNAGGDTLL